ncbi:hypothetical protein BT96DRAFT_295718 [Gymnopus androsaceus JB14]|uniref:Secreted protein n=1 Tax=Gymnopus androsaceus JB14 TaxID=1447944 RepID=A0A6A4I664_9AGAR|nr:hypothetical protein BT96DRAFT_295718 [Gymnopus androsaceus JB14]
MDRGSWIALLLLHNFRLLALNTSILIDIPFSPCSECHYGKSSLVSARIVLERRVESIRFPRHFLHARLSTCLLDPQLLSTWCFDILLLSFGEIIS